MTAEGGLVRDPELRFIPSGKAVVNFTIACKDRVPDGSGGWKDSDPCYLDCTLWGRPGENFVESVVKGDQVVVAGKLSQRSYEDREGVKRTAYTLTCDYAAVATTFHSIKVMRSERTDSGTTAAPADDPWATSAPAGEPPF